MEHEEIYTLMMEALDGELESAGQDELNAHLQGCRSCTRQWETIQAIHQLFLQSPILSPAADFTQRTLARLPNTRYRLGLISAVYGLLLLVGFVPLAIVGWIVIQFGPALNEPAFVRSLQQGGEQVQDLIQAVVSAGWQGLGYVGELLGQQPAIIGLLLVMVGMIFLWGGVYSQLTRPQRVLGNRT
jgi:anti-sigma factor RsiW